MLQVCDHLIDEMHQDMFIMFNSLIKRMMRSLQDTQLVI
jgi:hypothetical protein